jgi:hypothetical protein
LGHKIRQVCVAQRRRPHELGLGYRRNPKIHAFIVVNCNAGHNAPSLVRLQTVRCHADKVKK